LIVSAGHTIVRTGRPSTMHCKCSTSLWSGKVSHPAWHWCTQHIGATPTLGSTVWRCLFSVWCQQSQVFWVYCTHLPSKCK